MIGGFLPSMVPSLNEKWIFKAFSLTAFDSVWLVRSAVVGGAWYIVVELA